MTSYNFYPLCSVLPQSNVLDLNLSVNTNIKEEVLSDFGYDLCYDMAQQYGHAQLVWYALNGTRVVEGEYTDKD